MKDIKISGAAKKIPARTGARIATPETAARPAAKQAARIAGQGGSPEGSRAGD